MRPTFEEYFPQAAAAWQALTGQQLIGWQSRPPASLPRALRQRLEGTKGGMERFNIAGQDWVAARSQHAHHPFTMLSRDPGGEADSLLELLASLLDRLDEEQAANQKFGEELLSAWNHLNFLFDLARIAAQGGELPELFTRLASALLQVTSAEETCLIYNQGEHIRVFTAHGGAIQALGRIASLVNQAMSFIVLRRGDNLPDELAEALPQLRNLILLPIPTGDQRPCLLALINHPTAELQHREREVLLSAAEQISVVVNASLARAAQEDNRRLEHELSIASQIQENLLPTHLPTIPGLEFAANLKPAYLVGGDFYDVQPVRDGLAIMVGDVAGKGIPAAMLTALIHATLKSEAQHHCRPAELLGITNALIYDELDRSGTFITAFLAVLQTNPLRLSYASAGHTTTLLLRAASQEVVQLESTGLPLGIYPHVELVERQLPLEQGDVLLLYSDGITEAENSQGRVLGMQALIDLLLATHPAQAQQQLEAILSALELHREHRPLFDDVVLFLARVQETTTPDGQVIPFVYTAEKSTVRKLAQEARQIGGQLPLPASTRRKKFLDELELAVSEIATNVVVHAYRDHPYTGRVQGRFTLHSERVCLDLIDNGLPFQSSFDAEEQLDELQPDMLAQDPPDRGYGLMLACRLLDVCRYVQLDNGRNHWHLEKFISGHSKRKAIRQLSEE